MHGKDPKLDREDLVTKPRYSIPDQLLTAQTAKGLKPKLDLISSTCWISWPLV
jgi:hypothetical protein